MPHLVRSLALAALSFGVALSALSATPPPLSTPNVTPEAAQGVAYYGALDGGATVSAGGNAAYEFNYDYSLRVSPVLFGEHEYVQVSVRVENFTDRIVGYLIKDGDLDCPADSQVTDRGRSSLRLPGGTLQSLSGVLLPGASSRTSFQSIGYLTVHNVGLLGPLESVLACSYSLSVSFIPLKEADFSKEKSKEVLIRRKVQMRTALPEIHPPLAPIDMGS